MTTLAERRAAARARVADPRCPLCHAPVVITITDAGAEEHLDPTELEIVAWPDLERAGADAAVEEHERVTGYTAKPGARPVVGVRVSPKALPGVPRTVVRTSHARTCPVPVVQPHERREVSDG
jgi:hypothetical protein